jgi:hypothetical protein
LDASTVNSPIPAPASKKLDRSMLEDLPCKGLTHRLQENIMNIAMS